MMCGRVELVRELKSLRKGRGLFASRIDERVGPALREVCAVAEDDGPAAIRQKAADRLTELAGQLPEDLRLATRAAFAIGAEVRLPLYQDRVRWAAIRLDRDPRTVRRRVDEAITQLAELAAAAPATRIGLPVVAPDGDERATELRVVVALERMPSEVLDVAVFCGGTLIARGAATRSGG